MTLVKRFTRLITADVHSVLDSIEEPVTLIKQHLREMEDAIQQERSQLRKVESLLEQTNKDLSKIQQSTQKLSDDLNLCLENKDDDLARKVIKQKLLAERQATQLGQRLEELVQLQKASIETLKDFQVRYEEVSEELDELIRAEALRQATESQSASRTSHFNKVGADEVEVALLQAKKQFAHSGE